MSDHSVFSCCRIPICKRSATSPIAIKRLPPQYGSRIGVSPFTDAFVPDAPFSSSLVLPPVSIAIIAGCQAFETRILPIYSRFHIVLAIVLLHVSVKALTCGNIYNVSGGNEHTIPL